jgi:hypothetical protein
VIRASENPVPPAGRARPANPVRPADAARPQDPGRAAEDVAEDVFVYRDTTAEPDDTTTAGREPDGRDASYWYDLSGDDSAQVEQEARGPFEPLMSRGPFEPLVSSSDPAPAGARPAPPAPQASAPAGGDHRTAGGRHAAPGGPGSDGHADSARAQAQRLEQIKDFYLTAEAIGDRNVDKHFDQLLAQQRELISEYFKQSGAGTPDDGRTGQAEAQAKAEPDAASGHQDPGQEHLGQEHPDQEHPDQEHPDQEQPGRDAGPSRSPRLIAEPPRVW